MIWFILACLFVFYVIFSLITIKSRLTEIEKRLGLYDMPSLSEEEIKQGIKKEHEKDFFNNLNK